MDERFAGALSVLADYTSQHVLLSAAALALGVAISLPLAVLASRRPRLRFAVLAVDLYRREKSAIEITDPGRWIRRLDDRQVLGSIVWFATGETVRQPPAVGGIERQRRRHA